MSGPDNNTSLYNNKDNSKLNSKIELFNKLGFIYTPIDLKFENGNKIPPSKKDFPSWKNLHKSVNIGNARNVLIRTGKISGITVLDIDIKNGINGFKELNKINIDIGDFIYNCIVVDTPGGGCHYIFKYDERFKTGTNCYGIKGLDIRNDGSILFAGDNYDIEFENVPEAIGKPDNELFEILENYKNKNIPKKKMSPNANVSTDILINDNNVINISNDINKIENNKNKITIEKLNFILENLNIERFDNYDDWIKIGSIVKYYFNDDEGLNLYLKHSKRSNKYDENECITKWDSFINLNCTIGSLFHMLKEDVDNNTFRRITYKINNDKELKANKSNDKYVINSEHDILKRGTFTDFDVADYFVDKYDNFIMYDNVVYSYNGIFWDKAKYDITKLLSNEYFYFVDILQNELNENIDNTNAVKFIQKALKNCERLRSHNHLKNMIEAIKSKIDMKDDVFDQNIYLVCFNNGTYNLKNNAFRENRKEDYITKCVGYDYEYISSNHEDMILLESFLNKVMPVKEELKLLLTILSTTLINETLEKIIILTGRGGNGKDTLITYLLKSVLGKLYYKANNSTIQQQNKGGVNVELANCHKKNLILFNEPDDKINLISSTLKELTGGKEINARGLYSSNTETKLNPTLIIMANDLPKLDKVDDAMARRLIVFKFNTMFMEKDKFEENNIIKEGLDENTETYYYFADKYFKSPEFIERVKLSMMNLMIYYFQLYKNNNYNLQIPQSIKENSKKYLNESDNFTNWFNSEYEKTDDKNDMVKIKDIWLYYQNSNYYQNLTKQDKREHNQKWFLAEKIKKNLALRKYFKERLDRNKTTFRNILTNYKKIENDDDDEY